MKQHAEYPSIAINFKSYEFCNLSETEKQQIRSTRKQLCRAMKALTKSKYASREKAISLMIVAYLIHQDIPYTEWPISKLDYELINKVKAAAIELAGMLYDSDLIPEDCLTLGRQEYQERSMFICIDRCIFESWPFGKYHWREDWNK